MTAWLSCVIFGHIQSKNEVAMYEVEVLESSKGLIMAAMMK